MQDMTSQPHTQKYIHTFIDPHTPICRSKTVLSDIDRMQSASSVHFCYIICRFAHNSHGDVYAYTWYAQFQEHRINKATDVLQIWPTHSYSSVRACTQQLTDVLLSAHFDFLIESHYCETLCIKSEFTSANSTFSVSWCHN